MGKVVAADAERKRKRPLNDGGQPASKVTKAGEAKAVTAAAERQETKPPHPFDWDPADDCETSLAAYRDIAPLLGKLAQKLKKSKEELRIYDPYYCQGGVAKHLAKLGFTNVHNENEDFYARLDAGQLPPHDVLMTSPPYSADHIRRLLQHAATATAPWVLLMPEYVHRKAYYQPTVGRLKPWFLVPSKPYTYFAVSGSRADNTHVPCRHWKRDGVCPKGDRCAFMHGDYNGKKADAKGEVRRATLPSGTNESPTPVVPFHSFWHVYLGQGIPAEGVMAWWRQKFAKSPRAMTLVRSVEQLPPPANANRIGR